MQAVFTSSHKKEGNTHSNVTIIIKMQKSVQVYSISENQPKGIYNRGDLVAVEFYVDLNTHMLAFHW